jgi:hypothetical protein
MKILENKLIKIIFLGLLLLIVTFIYRFPDLYAYLNTPTEMVYLGHNSWFDPHDVNVYTSAVHYAQSGRLLLPNLWTAIPNQPIVLFPIEMLFGYIFREVNSFLLLLLLGAGCGIVLILGIFQLLKKIGISFFMALITTAGITLGGGFGFLLYPNNIPSADMLNAITFYEAFYKPHEAICLLLYFIALIIFYEAYILNKQIKFAKIIIATSTTISFLIYPYFALSYFLITFPVILLNNNSIKKKFFHFVKLYFPAGFSVLFVGLEMFINQGFGEALVQHLDTSLLPAVFGYGILLPIFFYQLIFMKKSPLLKYLNWWVIATFALAFLPIGPGKIFVRGLFFPLVIIAVLQFKVLMNNFSSQVLKLTFWVIFFTLLCASSVYTMILRNDAVHSPQSKGIVYIPKEEYKIFDYLNIHTAPDSGILALYKMSNLIPAFTHNRTCIGNLGSVKEEFSKQLNSVASFYTKDQSNNFLKARNVSYVIFGPEEQAITNGALNKTNKKLKLVFETETTKLYKVTYEK